MATDHEPGNGGARGATTVAAHVAAAAREAGIAAGVHEAQPRRYPTGEITTMAERQRAVTAAVDTGGTMLRISLRDVVYFLGAIMTIAAIVWTLRSDIRDLKTTMDLQNKITEERWQRQAEDMKEVKAKQTLNAIEVSDMKIALAAAGIYTPKKPVTITNIPRPQGDDQ